MNNNNHHLPGSPHVVDGRPLGMAIHVSPTAAAVQSQDHPFGLDVPLSMTDASTVSSVSNDSLKRYAHWYDWDEAKQAAWDRPFVAPTEIVFVAIGPIRSRKNSTATMSEYPSRPTAAVVSPIVSPTGERSPSNTASGQHMAQRPFPQRHVQLHTQASALRTRGASWATENTNTSTQRVYGVFDPLLYSGIPGTALATAAATTTASIGNRRHRRTASEPFQLPTIHQHFANLTVTEEKNNLVVQEQRQQIPQEQDEMIIPDSLSLWGYSPTNSVAEEARPVEPLPTPPTATSKNKLRMSRHRRNVSEPPAMEETSHTELSELWGIPTLASSSAAVTATTPELTSTTQTKKGNGRRFLFGRERSASYELQASSRGCLV